MTADSLRPATDHLRPSDLRAASRLAVDAVLGVTGIVENLHHTIVRRAPPLGPATVGRTRGITGFVYGSIRGVTRLAGATIDVALQPVQALLERAQGDAPSTEARAHVVAALNGVLGDHLAATGNPLAIPMTLQHGGRPLRLDREALGAAVPQARGRIVVLVHGLCMHPGQWRRDGQDLGAALAKACDSTLLHLHYNTGLSIAANGSAFAQQLELLVAAWPVPVERIDFVGHSMGGLVARSACDSGSRQQHGWLQRLRAMVFLGTPHQGAPLEQGGRAVERLLGASPYSAGFTRLTGLRSAGIRDLRHGRVTDDGPDPAMPPAVALPAGVACHAVAGSLGDTGATGPGALLGDGLVPLDSALGRHADPQRALAFDRTWIGEGLGHIELLHDPRVHACVADWLRDSGGSSGQLG